MADRAHDDWRRPAALRFALALAVMAAGLVTAVVASGVAQIVGWGVVGVGITLAISFVFLEVGLSEDRERERARRPR